MSTIFRALRYFMPVLFVLGGILLVHVNPLAQSRFPSPTSHVSDLAGVLDSQTRARLEGLLNSLKERSKIDLYVATVDTGELDIFEFSRQLAGDWNIGVRNSNTKTLLLVVSASSKNSFTQFSKAVQSDLPEGVLGEMTQLMREPLASGRFAEAVSAGVQLFVSALAEKKGFSVADLEKPDTTTAPAGESEAVAETAQPYKTSANEPAKSRPRVVSEVAKKANAEIPATESPTPNLPEPTPSKEAKPKSTSTVKNRKPVQTADSEIDADESEEVELTLTLPLAKRAVKLKEFLDTHPNSKSRARATELLISTHAALGDQQLKNGDSAGGIEHLLQAIAEADANISDELFSGVISQIPMNLYLRGERPAAFKAAKSVETKFGTDAKRLLAVTGFYVAVERGEEAVRVAEAIVKLAPDLAEAHRMLALGLHISLRLDEAIAEYKRTLELDPNSKVSRASLADLYRAGGKFDEALALYDEQLKADPKDRPARAGRVLSLFELGRLDEANSALEGALTEDSANLQLLTGAAYWLAAHENSEKAFELARKAVEVEPRYTWAQIALSRALLGLKRPLEAERAMRFARQYGKFPTLDYELANVLAWMGLYEEAAEVLRESFVIKGDHIESQLAGRLPMREEGFLKLLAPERRAGIYQATPADSASNAGMLKALLAFSVATTQTTEGEKPNEKAAVAAAQEFASGTDSMRVYRQLYAASRLLRNGLGLSTVLEFAEDARNSSEAALNVPPVTIAVQADEFRELRSRAIASGNVPDVEEAPRSVLANILKGRIDDLAGWALFNQERYPEALEHLKQAASVLPAGTPSSRTALWHLGVVLEQTGANEEALDYYIRSYNQGERNAIRRSVIEQLYRKINGSLDGLEARLEISSSQTSVAASASPSPIAEATPNQPGPAPEKISTSPSASAVAAPTQEKTALPEPSPVETPKADATPSASPEITAPPEPTPTPAPEISPPISEESLRNAASRVRSRVKITGRILDANKNGIANVVVVLISPSGTVLASTTDTEGNYSFTVAPSQKTYRLIPSKDGFTFAPLDKVLVGLSDDQKEIDFVGTNNSP